ncbi:hypothetical protein AVEN_65379-1 [Araneus ventricosus]|uniref:Uncharacterized protein n=1 Tax=Araneus ventricosus TaxID=182803 RepID=A0A4Y2I1A0_ARAVE|nr:hypothetical protein AVEN_65379-1 [Araneus ventricosus]
MCPQAKNAILARILRFYGDLKAAPFLSEIKRYLHPGWLLEFAKEHLNYFTDMQSPSCSWKPTEAELQLIDKMEAKPLNPQLSGDEKNSETDSDSSSFSRHSSFQSSFLKNRFSIVYTVIRN